MKANEAPEKIYFSGQQQWSNPFIGLMQKCADTDIEYTQTEAFIEKACRYISLHQCEYIDFDEFKNYMKGE